jgi:hypothetical protein
MFLCFQEKGYLQFYFSFRIPVKQALKYQELPGKAPPFALLHKINIRPKIYIYNINDTILNISFSISISFNPFRICFQISNIIH